MRAKAGSTKGSPIPAARKCRTATGTVKAMRNALARAMPRRGGSDFTVLRQAAASSRTRTAKAARPKPRGSTAMPDAAIQTASTAMIARVSAQRRGSGAAMPALCRRSRRDPVPAGLRTGTMGSRPV